MQHHRYPILAALALITIVLSACAPAAAAQVIQPTAGTTQGVAPTQASTDAPGSVQINGAGATFP